MGRALVTAGQVGTAEAAAFKDSTTGSAMPATTGQQRAFCARSRQHCSFSFPCLTQYEVQVGRGLAPLGPAQRPPQRPPQGTGIATQGQARVVWPRINQHKVVDLQGALS